MAQAFKGTGILACGAYVPRWHLARQTVAEAVGWSRGRSRSVPGSRSFANWDEDSLTMAVEACREALSSAGGQTPVGLDFASTSHPFADRSNVGVLSEALNLPDDIELADRAGSRRAGTTALLDALRGHATRLVCAADCVDARPGSEAEVELGHGAAALLVGTGKGLATLLAHGRVNQDFVDQYRTQGNRFDYRLEARWVRDAGTRAQVSNLIGRVLEEAGASADGVDWLLLPAPAGTVRAVARDSGLESARTAEDLERQVGLCASAHPLLMLCWALGQAEPGQRILLIGAGQGFDALLLEVHQRALDARLTARLDAGRTEPNYARYLGVRRLLDVDTGMRGERDNRSAQSAAHRRHREINGFLGGRCNACGKLQFPREAICVHCHAEGTQALESMSGLTGEVNSFTEDWLAWSMRPPLMFGNVHFADGANVMLEFTDFEPGELATGQAVQMAYRIKDFDDRRGFRRYFWKPAPPLTGLANG